MEELNSWSEWRHYVIAELKRLNDLAERREKNYNDMRIQMAIDVERIKTLSTVLGSLGGALITLLIGIIIFKLTGG